MQQIRAQPAAGSPRRLRPGRPGARSLVVRADQLREDAGAEQREPEPGLLAGLNGRNSSPAIWWSPTRAKFEKHIAAAGLTDVVDLEPEFSTQLRRRWDRDIDLLYIDGKHDYWTFADDLRWSAWLPPGGEILVHDCYSSIGVTSGVLLKILPSRRCVYLDRAGSLARFTLRRPQWPDRRRVLGELPWLVRNVFLKVLLRLRLGRLARAFGHHSRYDPY